MLFSLPKGAISGPINEGPNGSVVQIVDKQEPTADDIARNLPATREKLLDQQRQQAFAVFAGTVMQRYQQQGGIIYSRQPSSGLQ